MSVKRRKKLERRERRRKGTGRQAAAPARRAPTAGKLPSWATARRVVQKLALERGEFAGYPMPLDNLTLRVSDRVYFRHGEKLDGASLTPPSPRRCSTEDVDETAADEVRNRWWSARHGAWVVVYSKGGRVRWGLDPGRNRCAMLIGTLGAFDAWDFDAEMRASERLAELVSKRALQMYLTIGAFIETSPRSHVSYVFRRLRPTIALGRERDGSTLQVLAALCMHPLAYYEGSWAGAMVPTDDVIAHLMMMRADEHRFWRMANQHPARSVESGL